MASVRSTFTHATVGACELQNVIRSRQLNVYLMFAYVAKKLILPAQCFVQWQDEKPLVQVDCMYLPVQRRRKNKGSTWEPLSELLQK